MPGLANGDAARRSRLPTLPAAIKLQSGGQAPRQWLPTQDRLGRRDRGWQLALGEGLVQAADCQAFAALGWAVACDKEHRNAERGKLRIEVRGELGAILRLAEGARGAGIGKRPGGVAGAFGVQIKLDAGTRNRRSHHLTIAVP